VYVDADCAWVGTASLDAFVELAEEAGTGFFAAYEDLPDPAHLPNPERGVMVTNGLFGSR
jgi:hypothetical protein